MTVTGCSGGAAEQPGKVISRRLSRRSGAWLRLAARPIHLSSSDSTQPNARAFSAPDWSVPIPNRSRSAGELVTGGYYSTQGISAASLGFASFTSE
jgi:lipocalin